MALIRGEIEPAATNQGQAGFLTGVSRLHISALRLADGPPGILTRKPSAALTATMGLAATFSRIDAYDNGVVIGDEANRLGIDITLEPFINLDRDPKFERGYNTYGEDPLLTGVIGSGVIQGIQSRGVMAQAKHFVGYDSGALEVWIDDQTLHEVYLAPFDAAVHAGVASIMCSYNRINGPYSCGNENLLIGTLHDEMGFQGFITSDWGAVHGEDYVAKGLDMEMPGRPIKGDPYAFYTRSFFDTEPPRVITPADLSKLPPINLFTGTTPEEPTPKAPFTLPIPTGDYKNLWSALQEGTVTTANIDRAAGNVLRQLIRFGYLDGRREVSRRALSGTDASAVIRRTSEDAAVLLKNDGAILPLAADKSGPIALIGPGAEQVVAIGKSGERSVGFAEKRVGPFAALKALMPGADLSLAVANDVTGYVVPGTVLAQADGTPGLAYQANGKTSATDAQIDFTGDRALPAGTNRIWQGTLRAPTAGRYILAVQSLGGRGTLAIDGKIIAFTSGSQGAMHGDVLLAGQDDVLPTRDGLNNARGAVELSAGVHALRLEVKPDSSGASVQIRLAWVTPEEQKANFDAAVAAAARAKTAVVFAWSRDIPVFALPGDQDRLIEAVAAANPNTVVVLNVSQPISMPWLNNVKSVLQMWWPGDEGGWATADVLMGRKNPAGRLPFTWAKQLSDYASLDPTHPERGIVDGKSVFSEGVDIGYRWFARTGTGPLYPFGYGLSYTSFSYSDLHVTRTSDGGLDAHLRLRNTGAIDGEEVAQVYVSGPKKSIGGVQFAVKALAGFERVSLKAGETKPVTIHIAPRQLQYWSTAERKWVSAAATRTLWVGSSSDDLPLKTMLH